MHDGRLTGAELAGFARHLNVCSSCSREVEALDRLAEAVRTSVRDDTGADELRVRRERIRLLAAFDRTLVSSSERRPGSQRWLWPAAAAGMVLAASFVFWRVSTGVHGVQPGPSAHVAVVQADATAVWSRHTQGTRERIVLQRGALFVHVDHAVGGKRLVIALPDGELEDIGTTFSVSATDGRTARVSVQEGSVVLRIRDKAPVALGPGQVWTADAPATPAPAPAMQAPVPTLDGRSDQRPSVPVQATQRGRLLAAQSSPRPHDPPDSSLDFNAAMAAFDHGDCHQAAAGLDAFIAAHPQDARSEDAAYLRVMSLRKCGDERSMKAAAVSYLQRYPAGFRRLEVERLAR
jgi:hypothetical protein